MNTQSSRSILRFTDNIPHGTEKRVDMGSHTSDSLKNACHVGRDALEFLIPWGKECNDAPTFCSVAPLAEKPGENRPVILLPVANFHSFSM